MENYSEMESTTIGGGRTQRYSQRGLLLPLSSAAAERAFSLLNSTFGGKQDNSLKDYNETSVMIRCMHACTMCL